MSNFFNDSVQKPTEPKFDFENLIKNNINNNNTIFPQLNILHYKYGIKLCKSYGKKCQLLLKHLFDSYKLYIYYDGNKFWDFVIFNDNTKYIRPFFYNL